MTLKNAIPAVTSDLEKRLVLEYGSIFLTRGFPPSKIVFRNELEVITFQESLEVSCARIGQHEIELQAPAMSALLGAVKDADAFHLAITARSEDSGRRSYGQTLDLWNRNVARGLEYWREAGELSQSDCDRIAELETLTQVEAVLKLEETRNLFFGTFFDKSILHSVAAPGASQHLSMLAFDVTEFQEERVERILATHGWYRTVQSDLPHFSYLGLSEEALRSSGLMLSVLKYDNHTYHFWLPDPSLLNFPSL